MTRHVYIAGPYSAPTAEARAENVDRALDAGDTLMDAGFSVFIPHFSHFQHLRCPRSREEWMAHDFAWLRRCDAVLRLPGPSDGADQEIVLAGKLGLPVFHSTGEVLAWR